MARLSAQKDPGAIDPQLYVPWVTPNSLTSFRVTATLVVPPLTTVQCVLSWARAP
jgi:hypothetical protein